MGGVAAWHGPLAHGCAAAVPAVSFGCVGKLRPGKLRGQPGHGLDHPFRMLHGPHGIQWGYVIRASIVPCVAQSDEFTIGRAQAWWEAAQA